MDDLDGMEPIDWRQIPCPRCGEVVSWDETPIDLCAECKIRREQMESDCSAVDAYFDEEARNLLKAGIGDGVRSLESEIITDRIRAAFEAIVAGFSTDRERAVVDAAVEWYEGETFCHGEDRLHDAVSALLEARWESK
jgi:hypothetical protein